ncbi:MAG: hypothetical protein RE471_08710 [Ferroplasma sp.]|uniref:hypothetical protein n=1 Tax=Ferroplasma sp. TaxID=2591003 RepID=UPI002815375F|nr:hypothetical protein [Ferroplasma sp.]WMT51045.1 MAG: hypothetical protein RE471_08710 [Ferroplasma sp.]
MIGLNTSNIFIFIVILLILFRVIYRRLKFGLQGRQFKTYRLFTTPIIYSFLLIFFMAEFEGNMEYILIILLLIFAGTIPGIIYGQQVTFFDKSGMVFYKRSPYITIFWAVAFMIRILLEFIYPNNTLALFTVDALLAITLGLIIGESIKTYEKYKEYTDNNTGIL